MRVAGSWGMTDEQFAAAAARCWRRQALISIGFAVGSAGQLANYFAGDGSILALLSGIGFACCAAASIVAWRQGKPDTRAHSAPRTAAAGPTVGPNPLGEEPPPTRGWGRRLASLAAGFASAVLLSLVFGLVAQELFDIDPRWGIGVGIGVAVVLRESYLERRSR